MRKRLLILNLLLLGAIGVSGCVKYNGVPQEDVVESPIKLELSVSSMDLIVGDGGKTFSVKVSSEEEEIKDNKVSIANSNKDVVELDAEEVESDAKVRAKGLKDGESTLTITSKQDKNAKATLKVKVSTGDGTFAVQSVSITNKNITIKEGEEKKIEYVILPDNASNKDVDFSVSDSTFVEVSPSGIITGKKATTSAVTVTVKTKDGGKTDTCSVTVEADNTLVENNFYLVGSGAEFGNWAIGGKSDIKKKYELTRNVGNEYMVNFSANAGDEVKVIRYHADTVDEDGNPVVVPLDWYKANSYVDKLCYENDRVEVTTDGHNNIHFIEGGNYTLYFKFDTLNGEYVDYYIGFWAK